MSGKGRKLFARAKKKSREAIVWKITIGLASMAKIFQMHALSLEFQRWKKVVLLYGLLSKEFMDHFSCRNQAERGNR